MNRKRWTLANRSTLKRSLPMRANRYRKIDFGRLEEKLSKPTHALSKPYVKCLLSRQVHLRTRAAIIFFRINAQARNHVLDRLLRVKFSDGSYSLFCANSILRELRPIDTKSERNCPLDELLVILNSALRDLRSQKYVLRPPHYLSIPVEDAPKITTSDMDAFIAKCDV